MSGVLESGCALTLGIGDESSKADGPPCGQYQRLPQCFIEQPGAKPLALGSPINREPGEQHSRYRKPRQPGQCAPKSAG